MAIQSIQHARVFPVKSLVNDENGNPVYVVDKKAEDQIKRNAKGAPVQKTETTCYTQPDGKGEVVASTKLALLPDGSIGYFDASKLSTAEKKLIAQETAKRYFFDRKAPNKKGKVVVKRGLMYRTLELLKNIRGKVNSPAVKVDKAMADVMMGLIIEEVKQLEKDLYNIKPEVDNDADDMLRLEDLLDENNG